MSRHILVNQQERGHGKWKQCLDCGASTFGGIWYFGGYKSEKEPPCSFKKEFIEWQKQAEPLGDVSNE